MRSTPLFTAAAILVATLAVGGAVSAQSIYGPGGLFLNPTADFPPKGQLTPAILRIPQASGPNGLDARRTWYSYSLDYGLTEKLEVGAVYLKIAPGGGQTHDFQDASIGGFAKYRILDGSVGGRPDVAVGGSFLTGGDANARVAFAALRFTPRLDLRYPAHLHLGVLYANQLNKFQRHNTLPYVGVDLGLSDTLIFFAEVRARATKPAGAADVKPPSAVGLVWQPSRSLKIVVAYADNGWSDSHKISVGIGHLIGGRR
jgi:hypothetical protein